MFLVIFLPAFCEGQSHGTVFLVVFLSLQAFKVSAIKPGNFMVPFYVMFPIAVSRSSLTVDSVTMCISWRKDFLQSILLHLGLLDQDVYFLPQI